MDEERAPKARPRVRRPALPLPDGATFRGEVQGGVAGAIASLSLALSLGLLAFAPLGPDHAHVGVLAGFASAIYGQFVAALLGGAAHPGSAPRAAASLVLGAFVATLCADPALAPGAPHAVERVVALAGLAVVVAGLLQLVLGALGAGILARYVPYPFVAGFMCGASVLVIAAQLTPLTGVTHAELAAGAPAALAAFQPATLAVGLGTAAIIWAVARLARRFPSSLAGLVAGCALYYAIAHLLPGVALGPVVGPVPASLPVPFALFPLAEIPHALLVAHLPHVLAAGAVIAVIATLDGLFAAASIDHATDGRHDTRREVLGHGVANVVSGLCGGVPVVLSRARALASYDAGGRTPLAGVLAAVLLALVLAFAGPLLARVPVAVLGGIMVVLGVGLIDTWTHGLARRLRRREERADPALRWSVATVVLVAATAVFAGFVAAIAVGFVLSVLLLVVGMNRSLVRRDVDANARPSRRVWGGEDAARVRRVRERIRIVELEGAVFFGSAERLSAKVEPAAGVADAIVLDFRRVTAIDATGALLVERLSRRLAARGTRLLLAGVTPGGRHGAAFVAHDAFRDPAERLWFPDADRAVEWAEKAGLESSGRGTGHEVPVASFALFEGFSHVELAAVVQRLATRTIPAGTTLFREGDSGDRLCLIARGAIAITIAGAEARRRVRIVTMAPGSLFGEAALLDGRPRSASAEAVEDSVVHELTRAALDELAAQDPRVAIRLMTNLARIMSMRMRETVEVLRLLDDAHG